MPTRRKTSTYQLKTHTMITTMGVMLVLYTILFLLWVFDATGSLSVFFGAMRMSLLAAVIAIGATYFYLRSSQKSGTAKAPQATMDKGGYFAFKKDVESWMSQLADAIKFKTPFEDIELPQEIEGLKNHSKLNKAFRSLMSEMEGIKNDKQNAVANIDQKDGQIKRLEERLVNKDAEILKSSNDLNAAVQQITEQKQHSARLQQELAAVMTEGEKQKKEVASRIERYRNISKFLEQAKSTLFSQHGAGKEYLVQLKLGLLADDAINLSNKNDYYSLNYELFRNGRPFEQLLKEQSPTHIDAYPESVKKLRQWIKASGLENENWDLFYQNYPVTDRDVL